MAKKIEPWYFKYLRSHIRQIFRWSPERKKALKRAQISKSPELYECEECGKKPLTRQEKELDHLIPCENPQGWDGWSLFIQRTIEVPAELLCVTCKPCHYKKSAEENATRKEARDGKRQGKAPKKNK